MSSIGQKTINLLKTGFVLARKELVQNWVIYLIPATILLPLLILKSHNTPFVLNAKLSVVVLVAAFILAIVYGLQSFASETDRKTLDFILSRPISSILLITVKFTINMGIFLFWMGLYIYMLRFDWSLLNLPPIVGGWLFLSMLIVLSMGFFSGLIVQGAERLVITVGLTGLLAGGCYILWNQAFTLMSANFFWFDIPPNILSIVGIWLPMTLIIVSLLTPLVFSLWYLRGRVSPTRFQPFRRLALCWFFIIIPIELSCIFFAPAIWPDSLNNPTSGDWHPTSGMAIAGSYYKDRYPSHILYVAHYGTKVHQVYTGSRIHSPRWSPDGQRIAFVDGSWIKILHGTQVRPVIQGDFPFWSQDGKSISFCHKPDKKDYFDGIYRIDLATGKVTSLYMFHLQLLGAVWDSHNNKLYLLHEEEAKKGFFESVDLKSKQAESHSMPSPIVLYMQKPILTLASDGRVLVGFASEHEIQVYIYSPVSHQVELFDDYRGHEVDPASQPILATSAQGYLIPRLGGGYLYKGIIPPHQHHPGDGDE